MNQGYCRQAVAYFTDTITIHDELQTHKVFNDSKSFYFMTSFYIFVQGNVPTDYQGKPGRIYRKFVWLFNYILCSFICVRKLCAKRKMLSKVQRFMCFCVCIFQKKNYFYKDSINVYLNKIQVEKSFNIGQLNPELNKKQTSSLQRNLG